MRILLIDDDELSRSVLELHLSAAGYEVVETESGEAAIELLRTADGGGFDIILCDLQMPGLRGPELAKQLRALSDAPLLAMSGSQPAAERYAGFDTFLLKPFTPEQFEEALRSVRQGVALPMASAAAEQAEVLDEAVFAQLASMMRPTQLSDLFVLSFTELEKHMARMLAAFEQADHAALEASAHAMKGGFSVLGASEMRVLGARLEAGTGTAADQAATLREIPLAAERLRRMLTSRGLQVEATRSSGQETR